MAFKRFKPKRNFPRKMFQGSWKCADCGVEITQLPFEPAPDRPVYCQECWRKRRAQKFGS
jgi:CxxC-x17-CxxC domain-containing protein